MNEITRVQYSHDAKTLKEDEEDLAEYLPGDAGLSAASNPLGFLTNRAVEYVGIVSYISNDRAKMYRGLQRALHWHIALFHVSGLQQPYTVDNFGEPQLLKLLDRSFAQDSQRYKLTWALAWVGRSAPLQDVLLECGSELVTNVPGVGPSDCSTQIYEAFENFQTRPPHWHDAIVDALQLIEAHLKKKDEWEFFVESYIALRIMEAFKDPTEEKINQRLHEAITLHKRFVGIENKIYTLRHALAWVPLGLAAQAHDLGIPIHVKSDYLPLWMVRGDWPA